MAFTTKLTNRFMASNRHLAHAGCSWVSLPLKDPPDIENRPIH